MKCPTCGRELERPTRTAFRAPVELEGVTYRAKDCRACLTTWLTAELLLMGEGAEKLEEALELTNTLEDTLRLLAMPKTGTADPAS